MGLFGFELALFFWALQSKNWLCSAKNHVLAKFGFYSFVPFDGDLGKWQSIQSP